MPRAIIDPPASSLQRDIEALDSIWDRDMDATIQQDYFSTVMPDGIELIAAPAAIRVQPRNPHARPIHPRALRRDPVRPIPLSTQIDRALPDLYPREGVLARFLSTGLALLVIMGTLGIIAHFASAMPPAILFNSPSLNSAATHLGKSVSPLIDSGLHQINSTTFALTHRWVVIPANVSIYSIVTMSVLAGCLAVMFVIGRRIAGSFGGLLALLLASVALLGAILITDFPLAPIPILANGFAMVGMLLLATGGRQDGVSSGALSSAVGSVLIGIAAVCDRAEVLLMVPLLIVCINLPWRWSWLMLVGAAAPIAGLIVCDSHFFGVRQSFPVPTAALGGNPVFVETAVNWLQRFPSAAIFLPLAVMGFGLLFNANRRWGLLLLGWCAPAFGLAVIYGINADQRAIFYAVPAAILTATWLISRSPVAGGIVVALVSLIWLHAPLPTPLSPAGLPRTLPAQPKSMSTQDMSIRQFIVM